MCRTLQAEPPISSRSFKRNYQLPVTSSEAAENQCANLCQCATLLTQTLCGLSLETLAAAAKFRTGVGCCKGYERFAFESGVIMPGDTQAIRIVNRRGVDYRSALILWRLPIQCGQNGSLERPGCRFFCQVWLSVTGHRSAARLRWLTPTVIEFEVKNDDFG